jgi:hypothetical protein
MTNEGLSLVPSYFCPGKGLRASIRTTPENLSALPEIWLDTVLEHMYDI